MKVTCSTYDGVMGRKYTLSANPLLVWTVAMFGLIRIDSIPSSRKAFIAWEPKKMLRVILEFYAHSM